MLSSIEGPYWLFRSEVIFLLHNCNQSDAVLFVTNTGMLHMHDKLKDKNNLKCLDDNAFIHWALNGMITTKTVWP